MLKDNKRLFEMKTDDLYMLHLAFFVIISSTLGFGFRFVLLVVALKISDRIVCLVWERVKEWFR